VTCADEQDQLWSIGPDRQVKVLLKDLGGKRLNGRMISGSMRWGDLLYRSILSAAVLEPGAARAGWGTGLLSPAGCEGAFYSCGGCQKANGIVGTPDGRRCMCRISGMARRMPMPLGRGDGCRGAGCFVCKGRTDDVDERGNVYLTGMG